MEPRTGRCPRLPVLLGRSSAPAVFGCSCKKRKKKGKRGPHTHPRRHIYKRARGPSGVFVSRVCEHLFRIRQPGIFRECRLQRPECPPVPRPISQPPGLSHVWMQTNSHQNKQTRRKSVKLSTSPLGQYASAPPFVAARGRSQQAIIGIFLHRLNFAGNGPPAPVCFWFQLNFSAG